MVDWLEITTEEDRGLDIRVWAYTDAATGRVIAKIEQDAPGGTFEVRWNARLNKFDAYTEEFILKEQAEKYVTETWEAECRSKRG